MTWVDITLLIIWIISLAVGARLGSLWIGACVIGGFLGTGMADYYSMPLAELMGGFAGAGALAAGFLFLAGLILALIPGWLLSKISSALFLGIIDSAIGFVTGGLIGIIAISMVLLIAVPLYPKIEKTQAWRNSILCAPFQKTLEAVFNSSSFNSTSFAKNFKEETMNTLKPAAEKAVKEMKNKAGHIIEDIK